MPPRILARIAGLFLAVTAGASPIFLDGPNSRVSTSFSDPTREVDVSGLPRSWAWRNVVVQWSTYGSTPLDIEVSYGPIVRRFKGWTIQVALPDPGANSLALSVRNLGGAKAFDVTWWVSPNSERSTIPVSGTGIPVGRNILIGQEGVPVAVTTSSTKLLLFGRPDRPHNVLQVRFESREGTTLSGAVAISGRLIRLNGTSKVVEIAPNAAKTIPLVYNSPSKTDMNVSWTAVDRAPNMLPIPRTTSATKGGIVANYDLPSMGVNLKPLVLRFDSSSVRNGSAPTISFADVLPSGVVREKENAVYQSFDIHGDLVSGKKITIALPVPELARGLSDTEALRHNRIRHYLADQAKWETIRIDSIRGGYAYFQASSFSWYSWATDAWDYMTDAVDDGWNGLVGLGGSFIGSAFGIYGDIKDGLIDAYKWMRDGFCDYMAGPVIDFAVSQSKSSPLVSFSSSVSDATSTGPLVTSARLQGDLTQYFNTTESNPLTGTVQWANAIVAIQAQLALKTLQPVSNGGTELARMDIATANVRAFLNDAFLQSLNPNRTPRFKFGSGTVVDARSPAQTLRMSDLILTEFPWASLVQRVGNTIRSCESSISVTSPFYKIGGHFKDFVSNFLAGRGADACREVFGIPEDLVSRTTGNDLADCISSAKHMNDWMRSQKWDSEKDKVYLGAADYLATFDLFLWLNSTVRFDQSANISAFAAQFADYHDFVRIMLEGNNIAIKGELTLGFHELLMGGGDPTRFRKATEFLADHLGPGGGYAEGTSYLEYVNQTLFPLVGVAVREGWVTPSVLPQNYLATGDWELGLVHANGYLTPVDDAVNQVPFLSGYAGIYQGRENGLGRFNGPSRAPENVMELLSMPAAIESGSAFPSKESVHMVDGAGMVAGRSPNGLDWSLSILAESGDMLAKGHGHDQQDNGSIVLASAQTPTEPGFLPIVADPGYGDYERRDATAGYNSHSVLRVEGVDQLVQPNGHRGFRQLWSVLDDLEGGSHSDWSSAGNIVMDFAWMFNSDVTSILGVDHGGGAASTEHVFDAGATVPGLRGIGITQVFDYGQTTRYNRRTALFAGGHFLLVDRLRQGDGKPAPQFRYVDQSESNTFRFKTYGSAGEIVRFKAYSTPAESWSASVGPVEGLPQNDSRMPWLNLGTLTFHGSLPTSGAGAVVTFMPTVDGVASQPCSDRSSGYAACMEFDAPDGHWTVMANDYSSTQALEYFDPGFGRVRTTAELLVRKFDPSSRTTYLWTMGKQPTTVRGKSFDLSAGGAFKVDGSVWTSGAAGSTRIGRLPPPVSAEMIRRMLEN